jgi:uncharacterized membrane protein YidH (DUF202 family)
VQRGNVSPEGRLVGMKKNYTSEEDLLMIEEIQFLLQEKRTALKIIRIGATVFMVEMAALGYLLSAFKRHVFILSPDVHDVLIVLGVVIMVVTIGLMVGPIARIHHISRKIEKFKQRHERQFRHIEARLTNSSERS